MNASSTTAATVSSVVRSRRSRRNALMRRSVGRGGLERPAGVAAGAGLDGRAARGEAAGDRARPEERDPREGRDEDVDPDELARELELVLRDADRALGGDQQDDDRERALQLVA